MPKRIDVEQSFDRDQVVFVWRECWGKKDRYLVMTPQEAERLSSALYRVAQAQKAGEALPDAPYVCEFNLTCNA